MENAGSICDLSVITRPMIAPFLNNASPRLTRKIIAYTPVALFAIPPVKYPAAAINIPAGVVYLAPIYLSTITAPNSGSR